MTQSAVIAQQGASDYSGTFRNKIINGDMRIDQRNAGASVTNTSDAIYCIDRWQMYGYPQNTSAISAQQVSTPTLSGYTNSVKITSLAAATVGSLSYTSLCQQIEGYNIHDLAWGTASAKTVTLSFWVYSSITGVFGGSLQNSARNRCYPFTYTISSANTWTYISLSIPGCTDGTWLVNNAVGIQLAFQLGIGSTYSGTAGSWSTSNLWGATGATNIITTNGATWYVTGVQLETGSSATAFERRPFGLELSLCQRYYIKSYNIETAPGTNQSGAGICNTSYRNQDYSSTR